MAQKLNVVTELTANTYVRDGRVSGPATQLVEQTLQRAGLTDYRVDLYPWARAQDLALREPFVLIFPIARTPERESRFHWVGEIKRSRYFLYALRDRAEMKVTRLEHARAWTTGVVRNDVRQQALLQRGFTRLAVSAQPMENFRKLLYRQVDLVVLTENEARSLCEEAQPDCVGLERVLPLDDIAVELYIAYSLNTPQDVVARTRTAFETLRTDGTVLRVMGPGDAVQRR
ncbi:ABC transporter substrate-binding protein [Xylophilus sp. Kf1]|nr:ABC transporter substrate-binding protein [Xylophilus sp. Kf1]